MPTHPKPAWPDPPGQGPGYFTIEERLLKKKPFLNFFSFLAAGGAGRVHPLFRRLLNLLGHQFVRVATELPLELPSPTKPQQPQNKDFKSCLKDGFKLGFKEPPEPIFTTTTRRLPVCVEVTF